jgi:hypothetical protein
VRSRRFRRCNSISVASMLTGLQNLQDSQEFKHVNPVILPLDSTPYLQPACSQPQRISVTPESSAFSQYSPQYLLSLSAIHSQTACAHFLSSAITTPLFSIDHCWGLKSNARTATGTGQATELVLSSSFSLQRQAEA